jgi:hypothetical protein
MNAAEILVAIREAGAALRVEGDSLIASNASRITPDLKAAIRENKPQIIASLAKPKPSLAYRASSAAPDGTGCNVEIVELPLAGRYRKTFAFLQLKPPDHVPVVRWRLAVADGKSFLARWGAQAESLGWSSADLFGLHHPPEKPHPSYSRLSRYDQTGLVWLLEGREVVELTENAALVANVATTFTTTSLFRRNNRPSLGPLGDSLDDLK